jgi:3-deoxy-manno-octulosonate cytidylyltransferase (CMP-KDO synthetase)
MIQRVYTQALKARNLSRLAVATDDPRIQKTVENFGGEVILTQADHPSGTDRLAEVAEKLPVYDAVLNIQGDMPFLEPGHIDTLCDLISGPQQPPLASLMVPIATAAALENPNIVKVVTNAEGYAIYFSRSPVPYVVNTPGDLWVNKFSFYKHVGLYAYRSAVLSEVAQLPPGDLEKAESLEQLRWIEAGYQLLMGRVSTDTPSIDTPGDLEEALLQRGLKYK